MGLLNYFIVGADLGRQRNGEKVMRQCNCCSSALRSHDRNPYIRIILPLSDRQADAKSTHDDVGGNAASRAERNRLRPARHLSRTPCARAALRDLTDISVLSKSCYGRNLSCDKAVIRRMSDESNYN